MSCYAIVKIGHEYVVQVNAVGVMKCASRRMALRLVSDAQGLMNDARTAEEGVSAMPAEAPSLPCED